ncbi:unnamed protein product [Prorocentrum cordatum]|uniref:Uncharacterized protein n=1 Tax=Prorocentrum cordatum TaxID=2364126 RepID=A0ABN9U6S9_9DINO|nr:unnamed protein product [Polarella glacialis]
MFPPRRAGPPPRRRGGRLAGQALARPRPLVVAVVAAAGAAVLVAIGRLPNVFALGRGGRRAALLLAAAPAPSWAAAAEEEIDKYAGNPVAQKYAARAREMQEVADAARREAEKFTAERRRAKNMQQVSSMEVAACVFSDALVHRCRLQDSVLYREWAGSYSEKRFSSCRRVIAIVSDDNGLEIEVRGNDGFGPNGEPGCDKKDANGGNVTKWTAKAFVKDKYSDEITADFTPRRGLSSNSGEVTGKFDGSAIDWSDGTQWIKNSGFGGERTAWEKEKTREKMRRIAQEVQKLRAQRDGVAAPVGDG